QEHQFGFGFSEDLNTTLPGISAQASRNTEWDVYGLTLHFTPEAQAQIATAPLLPPLVFRKA
ncbi:hypothetical protein HYS97_02890, partial [Candidatus Daviesbacteria bacterium]|nr:hypothetical protein [Candidatus Daviesbacteria bacterium]